MERPTNAEEFFALPVAGGFGSETRVINGQKVLIPVLDTSIQTAWVPHGEPSGYYDASGQFWRLGEFKDGSFGRLRGF